MIIDAEGRPYGSKAKAGDAGTDLKLDQEFVVLAPGDRELLHTGAYVDVDNGVLDGGVGLVFGRSGLANKYGLTLANSVGVVDSRYRGEILVNMINQGKEIVTLERGDRIAQFVGMPILGWTDEGEERGEGGHGSSGR